MKPLALLLSLAAVFSLTQCASKPPPAPGSNVYAGEEESAYRRAYYFGYQDGQSNRPENYERYHPNYTQQTESAFLRGYMLGYAGGQENAAATDEVEDSAFNLGYDSGKSDAENGNSPFFGRHEKHFTPATEETFRKGYVQGYNEGRKDLGEISKTEREAYGQGYRQGDQDQKQGISANGESHTAQMPPNDAQLFLKGYLDGYQKRTSRF